MKSNQQGFTLIELVVVIVILGILAATALPKFVDLSVEAGDAAAQGVAGALASGSNINYAKVKSGGTGTAITAATKCSDLTALMTGAQLSSDGKVAFVTPGDTLAGCGTSGNVDSTCYVKHSSGTATGFKVSIVCTG